jgi:hypothetical protein
MAAFAWNAALELAHRYERGGAQDVGAPKGFHALVSAAGAGVLACADIRPDWHDEP